MSPALTSAALSIRRLRNEELALQVTAQGRLIEEIAAAVRRNPWAP